MANYEKIYFCADRPDSGASSGGASGVMYLLRKYLDEKSLNCQVEYLYDNCGRLSFIVNLILKKLTGEAAYYIAHEPDSAAILSYIGQKYILVYHQQGPLVQEYMNHTERPKKWGVIKKRFIEKRAFLHAEKVFFPSNGAADEYFRSPYAAVKRGQVNVGEPLYNTINADEDMIPLEQVSIDRSYLTFLSVGRMSELKGQDLSLIFIKEILRQTDKKIRWITVGDGLIKEEIRCDCNKLMEVNKNFKHIHFDNLPRGSVIYLDSIADVYLMLHRSSIFDLSTLEAMSQQCALVLSNVGGNKDFNVRNNCILVDIENITDGVKEFLESDIEENKLLNEQVYNQCFSPKRFEEAYVKLIRETICKE